MDVTMTKRRPMMDYPCLLQCGVLCNSVETISSESWRQLETKAKDWKDLQNFGNVFESTNWEKRAEGLHFHERCYITPSSKPSLQQSQKRTEKENAKKNSNDP